MVQELEDRCYIEVTRYGTSRPLPQPYANAGAFLDDDLADLLAPAR
jgi:hypothetical protein